MVWYDSLAVEETAKVDVRIGELQQNGPDLFRASWCAPLGEHIWKMKIHGKRQLRLMLCKGPVDRNAELTLLYDSIEKDGTLIPGDAVERAVTRMEEIASNPRRRRAPWPRL